MKNAIVGLSIGIILVVGGYFGYQYAFPEDDGMNHNEHAVHIHSDFAVFIDGQKFNFAQEKYMVSTDVCKLEYQTKHTHMHDMNGDVAHVHAANQTWEIFFQNINWKMTDTSMTTDEGKVYENTATKKWRYFVNGKELPSLKDYVLKDLDQVLITYGASEETEIQRELGMITKKACIYSGACPVPEGVELPKEYCGSE